MYAGKIVMTLAAAALVAGCAGEKKTSVERSSRVVVGKLEKQTFRHQIPVQGTVVPLEYATISAKISGTLEELKVDEGDRRKAGDILFGIDRQVLKNQLVVKEDEIKVKEAALKTAEFSLKSAEIQCAQTQQDYIRALTLRDAKAVSQANFESAETAYKKAQTDVQRAQAEILNASSQLKQAQSNFAIARKNLEDSVIAAPFDCVVVEKFVEENEFVSAGQNIVKLENHNRLEVECYISAVYYPLVTPGATVAEFLDAGGKPVCRTTVSYKAPAVDPASRTFKLKVNVPADVKLVSGMLCDLNLVLQEKSGYGLPVDAVLLRAGGRRIAFTVNSDNRAESVDVECGITDGNKVEILNYTGIIGKKFVITGQTFINNGALLQVAGTGENK